jgi:hypothetical protein
LDDAPAEITLGAVIDIQSIGKNLKIRRRDKHLVLPRASGGTKFAISLSVIAGLDPAIHDEKNELALRGREQ